MCNSCHSGGRAREQFADPLAKSRHNLESTVSPSAPFTCLTCHRPVTDEGEPPANLMRDQRRLGLRRGHRHPCGRWLLLLVPRHRLDAAARRPHGLRGLRSCRRHRTGHRRGIKCDACHESHSSRNESLNKYSGYMVCMQCHTSATSDPANPDLWSRLTLNPDANAKHPILPQDQANGSAMSVRTATTRTRSPKLPRWLIRMTRAPARGPRPTRRRSASAATTARPCRRAPRPTPWAGAVLASGAATTVTDIELAYQRNVHGFGAENTRRPPMRTCGRHGLHLRHRARVQRVPRSARQREQLRACGTNVTSADGSVVIKGVVVAPVPGGGYDLRFFCNTCHVFDPATHESHVGHEHGELPD